MLEMALIKKYIINLKVEFKSVYILYCCRDKLFLRIAVEEMNLNLPISDALVSLGNICNST